MGRDKHMINLHNSSEEFRCSKCPIQCVSAEVLEKHQGNHLEFVCGVCGVEFQRRYHLDRHQENSKCTSTVEKNEHKCDVCGRVFLRVDNLRVHLRGHMNQEMRPKVHQCNLCEKTFYGASMLLIHIRTHTGERPFPCDLCTKAFPSNGALRKHRRVHTGEKPYECSFVWNQLILHHLFSNRFAFCDLQQCPMKFAAKETLNRHVKTHTGKKSYRCDECGISFIQRTQLKNHLFHHTGEHGHQCPHCDEKFDNKPSMTRHIASEHNMGIKCDACGSIFSSEEDLKSHEEGMHGKNKSESKFCKQKLHINNSVTLIPGFICENCCLEFEKKSQLLEHVAACGGKKPEAILSCGECGKVYKRHDLLVKHERTAHLEKEETSSSSTQPSPKKRGRPRKAQAGDQNKDEIFNQLRQNVEAAFPENSEGTLEMDEADYRTERTLRRVLEDILVGMLDEAVLEKVGWPRSGILGTLEQVLHIIGVEVEEEVDEGTMSRLRTMMMALLGKFIGQEYLETMMNNYSTDQILHYMAASVRGNRAV